VSARGAQRVLLEQAKRDGQVSAYMDRAVVRRAAPHRALGVVQPGTDRKLEQIKPLSPHLDPQLFLKGEGEAGRAMIKHGAFDQKPLFLEQHSRREGRQRPLASTEGLACAELAGSSDAISLEFDCRQSEIERPCIEKIPSVGFQFVLHLIQEARGTREVKRSEAVEAQPQQAIEARKMIHVCVGNESMRDAHEFARGQRRHVAEVEQQRATAEAEVDEESENGSLTSRACTSQVTTYPCSFAKRVPAAAPHRATQKRPRRELCAA
jgi:hypothetical protein